MTKGGCSDLAGSAAAAAAAWPHQRKLFLVVLAAHHRDARGLDCRAGEGRGGWTQVGYWDFSLGLIGCQALQIERGLADGRGGVCQQPLPDAHAEAKAEVEPPHVHGLSGVTTRACARHAPQRPSTHAPPPAASSPPPSAPHPSFVSSFSSSSPPLCSADRVGEARTLGSRLRQRQQRPGKPGERDRQGVEALRKGLMHGICSAEC